MGRGAACRAWRRAQPRDRGRDPRSHRQAEQPDPYQRPSRAPSRRAPEDPGRHYPPVPGLVPEWQPPWELPRTSVEDTVLDLIARGEDLRRRLRLDLDCRRPPPHHASIAQQGARRPLEDALAGLDRRCPSGRRRRGSLAAGTQLRPRRGTRPRSAHGKASGQARHGSGNRYLDNVYEEYGVCVELDGVAAHPAEGRWRDTHRDNANLVQGTADAQVRLARRHRRTVASTAAEIAVGLARAAAGKAPSARAARTVR